MISFSEDELRVFKLVKEYAQTLNPIVTPRLAGGFVRDRIMGISSHDIDITLDHISGYNFALGLCATLETSSNVHKIQANPEKSKHLEAAVVNICGFSIDFVHLRSEFYSNSRIPEINVGTPEEDAFRRDITINSLFYNLLTDEVEDFTGRGIEDIKNKVIDTPLNPEITLFDDPLRILRIFRFRSKFLFDVSERITKALRIQKIKDALETKVSKERIGNEIFRMLEYEHGYLGILEIVDHDYVKQIFNPRAGAFIDKSKARDFHTEYVKVKDSIVKLNESITFREEILLLYIVLQFFINLKIPAGKKEEYVNFIILRESFKSNNSRCLAVKKIEETIQFMKSCEVLRPIEVVLEGKENWLEAAVIFYIHSKNAKYFELIKDVIAGKYEKAYLVKPVVDGDFLIENKVSITDFKKVLKKCQIIQIENPKLTKKEIFDRATGHC